MQRKLELVTPPVRQALSFEFESLLPVMIDSGDMESSTVMVRHNGNTDPLLNNTYCSYCNLPSQG